MRTTEKIQPGLPKKTGINIELPDVTHLTGEGMPALVELPKPLTLAPTGASTRLNRVVRGGDPPFGSKCLIGTQDRAILTGPLLPVVAGWGESLERGRILNRRPSATRF